MDIVLGNYKGLKANILSFPEQYLQMTGTTLASLKDEIKPDFLRLNEAQPVS